MKKFMKPMPRAPGRGANEIPAPQQAACSTAGPLPSGRDTSIKRMDTKLPALNSYGVFQDDECLLKAVLSHHQTAKEIAKTRELMRLLQWVLGALLCAGVIAFAVHQGSPLPVLNALLVGAVGELWRRYRAPGRHAAEADNEGAEK